MSDQTPKAKSPKNPNIVTVARLYQPQIEDRLLLPDINSTIEALRQSDSDAAITISGITKKFNELHGHGKMVSVTSMSAALKRLGFKIRVERQFVRDTATSTSPATNEIENTDPELPPLMGGIGR